MADIRGITDCIASLLDPMIELIVGFPQKINWLIINQI